MAIKCTNEIPVHLHTEHAVRRGYGTERIGLADSSNVEFTRLGGHVTSAFTYKAGLSTDGAFAVATGHGGAYIWDLSRGVADSSPPGRALNSFAGHKVSCSFCLGFVFWWWFPVSARRA